MIRTPDVNFLKQLCEYRSNYHSVTLVAFTVFLVCVSMIVAGTGGVLAEGSTPSEKTGVTFEDQPDESESPSENTWYRIEVTLTGDPSGTTLRLVVRTWYPAQNETEAQKAENGSLALDWFDGDDRLEHAYEERNVSSESIEHDRSPISEFVDTGSDDEPHGRIIVTHVAHWRNVTTPYEPPVAELGGAFQSGDVLAVRAPGEAEHTNADSESYDRGIYTYRWTLESDNETPELVFEEGAFESEAHSPLGPAGGVVLSLLALLVAAHLRVRNQSR